MNRCLILFGVSFILMLIAESLKRLFGDRVPKDGLYVKDNWADHLSGISFVIGMVIFFVTLVFAVYIFIFNY